MAGYKHTQSGKTMLLFLGIALLGTIAALLLIRFPATWILVPIMGLLLIVGWLFSSLTVSIDGQAISWWFGPGFWKKRIEIDEIQSFGRVRNQWWWGWGIRYYGNGWLYNVSGLDAVELALENGKTLRIGTDEPHTLIDALKKASGR